MKQNFQEEFSMPGPWRWHYYFQGPETTLDQVMQLVAEGIEGFLKENPTFARSEAAISLVAVSKEKPTSGWQALRLRVAKTGKMKFCVHMRKLLDSKGLLRVTIQPVKTGLYNKEPLSELAAGPLDSLPKVMTS